MAEEFERKIESQPTHTAGRQPISIEAPKIDPGNEVSKVKPHSLPWIIECLRRHPEATLARGEGGLLLAEIDRLRNLLSEKDITV